jgi:hypothetical protein
VNVIRSAYLIGVPLSAHPEPSSFELAIKKGALVAPFLFVYIKLYPDKHIPCLTLAETGDNHG